MFELFCFISLSKCFLFPTPTLFLWRLMMANRLTVTAVVLVRAQTNVLEPTGFPIIATCGYFFLFCFGCEEK